MTLPEEMPQPDETPAEVLAPQIEAQPPAPSPTASKPRWPLFAAIAVILLLIAAAGGFFWLRGQESQALARAQSSMAAGDWASAEKELLAARGVQPAFVQQHAGQVTALLAESYYQQKKYDLSQAELDRALALQPADAALLSLQARVSLDEGKLDQAAQAAAQLKATDPDAALPYGVEAWKALREQKTADALAAAEEALKRESANGLALRVRGTVRAFQTDLDAAKADLDAAVAANSEDVEALAARVYVNIALNQDALAAQDLEQLTALAPEHPAALWAQAIYKDKHHDRKTAQALMEQAIQKDGSRPEFYQARADTAVLFSELPTMQADLEKALAINPDFAPALTTLTQTHFDRYEQVDMEAAAKRLESLAPRSGMAQILRAQVLEREHQSAAALKLLDDAVALNPRSAWIYLLRSDSYLALDQVDRAVADIEKALELNPDYFSGLVARAGVQIRQHEMDKALESARKAQSLEPESPTAYLSESLMLMGKNDLTGARAAVEKALKLDPNNPRALYLSSTLAGYEGKFPRALSDANLAIKNEPNAPFTYLARAMAYLAQQKVDAARADAKKVTEIAPQLSDGWQLLARVELASKNWDAVLTNAEKATQLNPRDALSFALMGQALAVSGKLDQALPNLKKAVSLQDDLYPYTLMLAMAQRSSGDFEGAKATLDELMKHKDQLDINVLQQAEQEMQTLAGITRVTAGQQTYQDPSGRFSLKFSPDWQQLTNLPPDNPNLALGLVRQESSGNPVGVMMIFTQTAQNNQISARDLANEVARMFGSNTGYTFSALRSFKLGEVEGLIQDYEQSMSMPDGSEGKLNGRLYYIASGNRYVWLEFKSAAGDFERLVPEADAITSTLRVTK